jgi:putative IMPACT (imprinted ancient) family translation regulator
VVVAVVRYYGGVNLGAGGLVRAYGGAAAEVLRVAEKLEVHPRISVKVRVAFEVTNALYRLLERFDVQERVDDFDEHGLEARFSMLQSELDALRVAVRDATRGQAEVVVETSHDDAA